MTITLGARLVHRARLHVPWIGRWVLRVWFDGPPPKGRVTVQWGSTALVGTVLPDQSGAVAGEGVATIVGGVGWHSTPPSTWLIDSMAAPVRIAMQLAQAVGETLEIGAGALRPGRVSFARAEQPASETLVSLLAEGAVWWVGLDGVTRVATRAALNGSSTTPAKVEVVEYRPNARAARLDITEPSQAPLCSVIAVSSNSDEAPQRVRSLDIESDEEGVEAWVSFEEPVTTASRTAALLEVLARSAEPLPHATWRAATVQSQDAQRRVSLRLEERDRELADPLPVPSWCGVPGVSAEVFAGTRTLLAFDRANATKPFAALWSPYGQAGHVPRVVYHEAHEELRFLGSSAGVARFGAVTVPVAKAAPLVTYLNAIEAELAALDDALVALVGPALTSFIAARLVAAQNLKLIAATRLEAE